jgi:hypothetical protein
MGMNKLERVSAIGRTAICPARWLAAHHRRVVALLGALALLVFGVDGADNDVATETKAVTRTTYIDTAIVRNDTNGTPTAVVLVTKLVNSEGQERIVDTFNIPAVWIQANGPTAWAVLTNFTSRMWIMRRDYTNWLTTNITAEVLAP